MRNRRGPSGDLSTNLTAIKRTFKLFFRFYPVLAPLAIACILFSSVVSSIPSLFIQNILSVVERW